MTQIRHLATAPITEAVFDYRVKAANDFQIDRLNDLKEQLAERFPKVEERRGGEVTIGFQPGLPEVVSRKDFGLQGYFLKSEDEKLIAQFRVDGFTLNRLAPYTRWGELYPLSNELWQLYRMAARPEVITRLAVRYINHIQLPWPYVDFDEYLRAGPNIPLELPQSIVGFSSRVVIHNMERNILAGVVQKYEGSPADQKNTIILDIDAFKNVDLAPDDATVQDIFEQLRDFKNLIFFSYLTDKATERYS